ncbi:MAG: septal ring lytic transglycosylase RlpA family protein, partial [Thiobacillus sp.]|nr:septal ring lytic transglycosylase RlpA family protein [Thiobacillus sp.]
PSAPAKSVKSGGYYLDDGPDATPPPNLEAIPDAVPRAEPLHRYANRPYDVLGGSYVPQTQYRAHSEEGVASWYGKRFHGKKTASGERYDMYAMTAAHPTLPIPSYVRVTSLANGKSVVVRINDRGPFHKKRIIDLSYVAATRLGYIGNGSTRVRVESLDPAAYDMMGEAIQQGVYLQVGAFSSPGNAQQLLTRLARELELETNQSRVVLSGKLHRVQLGPYPSDGAAQLERSRVQERLALNAILVRRD